MKAKMSIPRLPPAELEAALKDRNILIIGGTAGIGKAIGIGCLKRGAHVTVVGRRDPGPELSGAKFVQKDLSTMKSSLALADEVDLASFDSLVFTNSIMANKQKQVSSEGIELDLAVSYLSRFVFSRSLLSKNFGSQRTQSSQKPRIFVMGFPGTNLTVNFDNFNSEKSYDAIKAHMNTVVANEALVTYLNENLAGNVNVYGLNPGLIKTEIRDNYLGKGSWLSWIIEGLVGLFNETPKSYAERCVLPLLVTEQLEGKPGLLFDPSRKILTQNPFLKERQNLDLLIEASHKLADQALSA